MVLATVLSFAPKAGQQSLLFFDLSESKELELAKRVHSEKKCVQSGLTASADSMHLWNIEKHNIGT